MAEGLVGDEDCALDVSAVNFNANRQRRRIKEHPAGISPRRQLVAGILCLLDRLPDGYRCRDHCKCGGHHRQLLVRSGVQQDDDRGGRDAVWHHTTVPNWRYGLRHSAPVPLAGRGEGHCRACPGLGQECEDVTFAGSMRPAWMMVKNEKHLPGT
jgi:hypothetical protein